MKIKNVLLLSILLAMTTQSCKNCDRLPTIEEDVEFIIELVDKQTGQNLIPECTGDSVQLRTHTVAQGIVTTAVWTDIDANTTELRHVFLRGCWVPHTLDVEIVFGDSISFLGEVSFFNENANVENCENSCIGGLISRIGFQDESTTFSYGDGVERRVKLKK